VGENRVDQSGSVARSTEAMRGPLRTKGSCVQVLPGRVRFQRVCLRRTPNELGIFSALFGSIAAFCWPLNPCELSAASTAARASL